jgi:hypothetical protein
MSMIYQLTPVSGLLVKIKDEDSFYKGCLVGMPSIVVLMLFISVLCLAWRFKRWVFRGGGGSEQIEYSDEGTQTEELVDGVKVVSPDIIWHTLSGECYHTNPKCIGLTLASSRLEKRACKTCKVHEDASFSQVHSGLRMRGRGNNAQPSGLSRG